MIAAIWRGTWRDGIRRVQAGEPVRMVRRAQHQRLERGFDAVASVFERDGEPRHKPG
jgi:hypothetical protein